MEKFKRWRCACCGKVVKEIWNSTAQKYEPSSNYWKSSPPYYDDIIEVYCGPSCSLKIYEERQK